MRPQASDILGPRLRAFRQTGRAIEDHLFMANVLSCLSLQATYEDTPALMQPHSSKPRYASPSDVTCPAWWPCSKCARPSPWHGVNHGKPPASRCWNIGITIAPLHRGRGLGTEAQRLLAAYLLATTTVNRIEADTDVTNLAEQRSLEKAGFTREGTMRGAQFREGAWHDMVLFSRLRHD
jgi:GNAT superfamily N-acetyltransferase